MGWVWNIEGTVNACRAQARDEIMRRVQGQVLAKAWHSGEAEADAFRTKANDLMDAYRIEQWKFLAAADVESQSA